MISALAGRTREPAALPGLVRRGGFGGVPGLAAFLRREDIAAVVDATHPFASRMKANAIAATRATRTPLIAIEREAWPRLPGDRWVEVDDATEAARAAAQLGRRIFLTLGHRDLDAFAACRDRYVLLRTIEPPASFDGPESELILARGPFSLEAERALLRDRRIDVLVTKASGGTATYAKIAAARELGLPVVMIRRAMAPAAARVRGVDAAAEWVERRLLSGRRPRNWSQDGAA